jgi:hypothetical protein
MDEHTPAAASPEPETSTPPATTAAGRFGPPAAPDNRLALVITGGLVAGLGLSIAAALVMHVVQEFSPNGYAFSIAGSVWLAILIAGPVFGLGVAIALAALISPASTGAERQG